MKSDRLDTFWGHLYTARPLLAAALLVSSLASGEVVSGAQLPDGSRKVGEQRYRAQADFDGVMKYYRTVYPPGSYPRRSIINQPGVKAVHIANPSGKNFEGLNIYEVDDEVRIYIIASAAPPKKKPVAKPRKR